MARIEGFNTNKWFRLHPGITMSYIPEIADRYVPDADIILVTWWATALEAGMLSPQKGKKINLIQGYETWEGNETLLYDSYDMPDTANVVVSAYLESMVSQHTRNKITLIYNAIDNNKFHITAPVESRKNTTISMVYSIQEIKGSKYGIEALQIVKQHVPDLTVRLFGVCPEPKDLPHWINYRREPDDLCELYNSSAIFISNSLTEGFGLVSVEAMYCGCAVVCTDIWGHKEYAVDGETALLVEPQNPQDMAEKIISLIENNARRMALALAGNQLVQKFSWDVAVGKMDALIKKIHSK
jgi:glycosyltransferase involved in cell wall biosynthesis